MVAITVALGHPSGSGYRAGSVEAPSSGQFRKAKRHHGACKSHGCEGRYPLGFAAPHRISARDVIVADSPAHVHASAITENFLLPFSGSIVVASNDRYAMAAFEGQEHSDNRHCSTAMRCGVGAGRVQVVRGSMVRIGRPSRSLAVHRRLSQVHSAGIHHCQQIISPVALLNPIHDILVLSCELTPALGFAVTIHEAFNAIDDIRPQDRTSLTCECISRCVRCVDVRRLPSPRQFIIGATWSFPCSNHQ
ncbi:hypothetical protein C2E23DRAFT_255681 [Lenzites betulinus]|nr:hypothetical protein C2E23DRAFT_255681 [Lenzites betulinus]